ncbi:uncharacterized protein BO66DRAFT_50675 [Aspergillus aculeatinus CBS 121060]|uniref:Uncharacterized protein n=1 Tax=Aspergillus aculeatinus CBS 121060 TaxID=1448322 RepID=A0ACD1HCX5_9EURO|nr:hypothetical protein BO66DRAFT_50675 [Aspergillus aculeatinus CBS 121060]RAH71491.1 hypothetical protein BO66DRAFT_50675 [Aspergillus aculeatinus CBS 121060]
MNVDIDSIDTVPFISLDCPVSGPRGLSPRPSSDQSYLSSISTTSQQNYSPKHHTTQRQRNPSPKFQTPITIAQTTKKPNGPHKVNVTNSTNPDIGTPCPPSTHAIFLSLPLPLSEDREDNPNDDPENCITIGTYPTSINISIASAPHRTASPPKVRSGQVRR